MQHEDEQPHQPPFVLVMGVCGVGKSTVAQAMALRLDAAFVEADDHHTPANIQAMKAGRSLTDEQRFPWLLEVAATSLGMRAANPTVVIACSALKRHYRDLLRTELGSVVIIHLYGDPVLIHQRLTLRPDHFMPPDLLASQLADLEPPGPHEAAITLDVATDPGALVDQACAHLKLNQFPAAHQRVGI